MISNFIVLSDSILISSKDSSAFSCVFYPNQRGNLSIYDNVNG